MNKRRITYILFLLTLIATVSISYFWKRSPLTSCYDSSFPGVQARYIHPEKVVIKPWKGPHHVYGIFVIPGGHLNEKLFRVTIPDSRTYCGVLEFNGTQFKDFSVEPGYYIMRGLLNTRTALWLIFQGKGEQLQQPGNWQVGYKKIEKNKEK